MRPTFLATLALPVFLWAGISTVIGEEPPAPAKSPDETAAAAKADPPKGEDKDAIQLPLGFKPKKRGNFVVYCRKDSQMGTRLPVEICYDEQGIREYLQAQRDDQEKVDQMRRICGSQATCGSN